MTPIGRMVLDQNVDNFFAETEQVAFCTQNVVPGIDFTNDPLLAGRNFSYLDTQLKRLGLAELHPHPGERTTLPGRPFPAGRPHGDAVADGSGQLRTERLGRRRRPRENPATGYTSFPAEESGEAQGPARVVRRSLQPGAHVLSAARPTSSRPISAMPSCSNCRRSRPRRSVSGSCRICATSTRTSPRAVGDGLGIGGVARAAEPKSAPIDVDAV